MFKKCNPEIGARPGTLAIPPGSLPPKVTVVQYDAALWPRILPVSTSRTSGPVA